MVTFINATVAIGRMECFYKSIKYQKFNYICNAEIKNIMKKSIKFPANNQIGVPMFSCSVCIVSRNFNL